MGVQGFPTLKIVKPSKSKGGAPIVEDYNGPRTAKGIVDAVVEKIPNHVRRLKDGEVEAWLAGGSEAKAILFSEKGRTGALWKALAVDFLGGVGVAQMREKEREAVKQYGVEKFPTLVLIPARGGEAIRFEGEMKKDAMAAFLSQAVPPNPDPAPKKTKASSSTKSNNSKASKDSSKLAKASASQASAQAERDTASQTLETLENQSQPTESPHPKVNDPNPVQIPELIPILELTDTQSLQQRCLNSKAGTCILALLPKDPDLDLRVSETLASLGAVQRKHETAKRNLFPFFQLPVANPLVEELRQALALGQGIELLATNGKRAWYKRYSKTSFGQAEVEDWIDAIRMGEGKKETLPASLLVGAADLPAEAVETGEKQTTFESMKEALKKQMPEGLNFEFEEMADGDSERLVKETSQGVGEEGVTQTTDAAVPEAEATLNSEAETEKPLVDHIIDEL